MRRFKITKQSSHSGSQHAAFLQRKHLFFRRDKRSISAPKQLTRVQTFHVLQSAQMSTLGCDESLSEKRVLPISGLFSFSALTTAVAGGVRFSGCPFIPFLWTQYLRDALWGNFLKLGRFWWSHIRGRGHRDLLNESLVVDQVTTRFQTNVHQNN